jgi:hypothetical protein
VPVCRPAYQPGWPWRLWRHSNWPFHYKPTLQAKGGLDAVSEGTSGQSHGLEAHHDFDMVTPPVWWDFLTEGKTADSVERVLRAKFRTDADNPDAPDVTPYISHCTAREIVKGIFAPQDLTVEGMIHGLLPLAFTPRSGAKQYEAYLRNPSKPVG